MSVHVIEWVLEHSPVEHPLDRFVLVVVASHASDDGSRAFPSVATLAHKTGLSRRRVQMALRRLAAAGAIEQTAPSRPAQPRTYRVPMGAQGAPTMGARGAPNGRTVSTQWAHQRTSMGARGAPEPSVTVLNRPSLTMGAPRAPIAQEGGERELEVEKAESEDAEVDVDLGSLPRPRRIR